MSNRVLIFFLTLALDCFRYSYEKCRNNCKIDKNNVVQENLGLAFLDKWMRKDYISIE